jgi:hypothetical protein
LTAFKEATSESLQDVDPPANSGQNLIAQPVSETQVAFQPLLDRAAQQLRDEIRQLVEILLNPEDTRPREANQIRGVEHEQP